MKICRICKLEKNLNLFNIKNKMTQLYRTECMDCERQIRKKRYLINRESVLKKVKEHRLNNIQKYKERDKKYQEKNKETIKLRKKKYLENNKELINKKDRKRYKENASRNCERQRTYYKKNREERLLYRKNYCKNNRDKLNLLSADYKAKKLQACPRWLTKEHRKEMKLIYKECQKRSKETGVEHNVDHIVPLQSKIVCGLHVPWNLQILTKSENSSKQNKLIMGEFEC